jgi:type I restriction enzyme S subunit
MKDVPIEWLGQIPDDWSILPLKRICSIGTGNRDTIEAKDDGDFPFFVRSPEVQHIDSYSYDGEAVLTAGDGDVGKIFHYINGKYDCHQRVYNFTDFKTVLPKYAYYYLTSNFHFEVDKGTAKSTVSSLRMPMIASFLVAFPDEVTQLSIVQYLDTQCNLIDQQIAAVKETIEKLEQVKTSKVYQVITKGLDASVNYVDSGVPWIGQYPVSWDLRPLKSMFTINKRIAGTLGYDVLSITQKGIKIKDIISNEGQLSNDYSKYQIVKPGDFAMNHMDLLTGFVDLSEVEGVTSPDYRVFTPVSKDIDPHYALYIFQTAYKAKIFYGLGQGVSTLGRWRLPKEQFLNFVIPVPSLGEQGKIVRHLDSFCSSVDGLIQSYTDKLDSLMNFKASLVYEYVTGKKQVPSEVDA